MLFQQSKIVEQLEMISAGNIDQDGKRMIRLSQANKIEFHSILQNEWLSFEKVC